MSNLMNIIKNRRSTRAFVAGKLPERDKIEQIVEAALWAPAGMGKQLWHFSVVYNAEKSLQLAKAVSKALNRGEDLKPLVKVASGGEISRVMLGLKTIFSALNQTSLLVFDEIDSGVSGKVAFTIGQKMATIAKQAQVLAITHLAPVAAFADQHLFIYKTDDKDKTTTHIRELSYEERIKELAIMASSVSDKAALDAAQKLIEKAKSNHEE